MLTWPIGLAATAVKSGTRLHIPRHDVAAAYWRGLHRVFADVDAPAGSHLQFAQGNVADVLVRVSGAADLLVLGTRQPHRNHPYLAGSVARYCITHATCPVSTVPIPAQRRLHATSRPRSLTGSPAT